MDLVFYNDCFKQLKETEYFEVYLRQLQLKI